MVINKAWEVLLTGCRALNISHFKGIFQNLKLLFIILFLYFRALSVCLFESNMMGIYKVFLDTLGMKQ